MMMMMELQVLLCLFALIAAVCCVPPIGTQPEQVHISYPGVKNSMLVTWSTANKTESIVEYGLWGEKLFSHTAKGNSSVFTDGGLEKRTMYIHRVTLTDLIPTASYVYHCGSDAGWSDIFYFTSLNESVSFSPRFALFGDMGNENPHNFSHYKSRFSMPGHTENLWYSWNVGPAHIISFSTEVYFYLEYGLDLLFRQYEWLQADLQEANRPENRAQRPWIITMGHRPMYCSNDDGDDCTHFQSYEWIWSSGLMNTHMRDSGPSTITRCLTGALKSRISTDYGYTRMRLINTTHLYLEQVSDDQYGKVIDQMTLVKEKHGADAWR
ncbi:Acid phosphatase type 7 [Labeo rohita]|uniref:Purple acid phosphatase n=1 Tax=Labeo rohita TaxID=84645 RepID=A0ABQ8LTS9_LABRO|nr:Acid phosphatase type 7 [Labeo rohita]